MERHTAVQTFRSLLLYINDALQQMTQWHSYESRNTAQGLLNAISQPFFHHINDNTRRTVGIHAGTTLQSIDDLVIALEAMRWEEVFSKMFTCTQTIAQSLNIKIVKPRIPPQRSQYRAVSGNVDASVEEYYR